MQNNKMADTPTPLPHWSYWPEKGKIEVVQNKKIII
jgi:hypothetical protein